MCCQLGELRIEVRQLALLGGLSGEGGEARGGGVVGVAGGRVGRVRGGAHRGGS